MVHPEGETKARAYIARVNPTGVSAREKQARYISAGLEELGGQAIQVTCRGERVAELGFGSPSPDPGTGSAGDQLLAREVCEGVIGLIREGTAVPEFPLETGGTEFDRLVWSAILKVPSGGTVSYSELAGRIGRPGSQRAVARALGRNPVAVLVPCHRAIAADGSLGGYRWGTACKRVLIEAEAGQPRP